MLFIVLTILKATTYQAIKENSMRLVPFCKFSAGKQSISVPTVRQTCQWEIWFTTQPWCSSLDLYSGGGGRRYGLGLIKMMEWKSALAEQVLGRSSNCNEFSATVIKLSSGSEGLTARKKESEGDSAKERPDVVVGLLIRKVVSTQPALRKG